MRDDRFRLIGNSQCLPNLAPAQEQARIALCNFAPCDEEALLTVRHFPHRLAFIEKVETALDHQFIQFYTEFYAPVRLKRGDSAYYDAAMGHNVISVSEDDAVILWVTSLE